MPTDSEWEERRTIDALRQQPVIDIETFLINKGRAFSFSSRYTDIGNGDSTYLFLDNPSDSGYDYDIVLLPRATGLVDFDISFGATQNDGTAVTPQNLKSGSGRTFTGTVEESTTGDAGTRPTHGTTFIEDFAPGSEQGVKVGGSVINAVSYTVDEGSNKLVELINGSGGNLSRMALNMVIYEVDGTYKEI